MKKIIATLLMSIPIITAEAQENQNPLLKNWTGNYGGVPAFNEYKITDLKPAIKIAIQEKLDEYNKIANNPKPATFENTIVAMEKAGKKLSQAKAVFDIYSSNLNTPEFEPIEVEVTPLFSELNSKIYQNKKLFDRIETIYNSKDKSKLTPEQQRLVWYHYANFVREGAKASAESKAKIAKINQELASLFTKFSQNQLADESNYYLELKTEADFEGLPTELKNAAIAEAKERNLEVMGCIANTRSSIEPFLTFSSRRDLREKAFDIFVKRGDNNNSSNNNAILVQILKLRAQKAKLLGFKTFADWSLSNTMAQNPLKAMDLMLSVWQPAVAKVHEDVAQMQKFVEVEGGKFKIAPWDYRYYAEKVRKAKYDVDANQIKPYLQLEKLREGMFWVAGEVFNLNFKQVNNVPVFHQDVRVWEVSRKDSGKKVGLFYFDPYARKGKRSGAWMTAYREQSRIDGDVLTLVSNNCNFIKGNDNEPILISWDDASTLFHEFGHALHGLCSDVTYPSLSGTNTPRDYVEFPSQILERWLSTPEVLNKFALHYQTKEPMPMSLVKRIEDAATFNEGFSTVETISSALVDMKLHLLENPEIDPRDFERATLFDLKMPSEIVMRHRIPQFGHIFSGDDYAAGYYGYLWADVISADATEAFTESKGGLYDKEVSKRLLDNVFSIGNTIDPEIAYKKYRGKAAKSDALMRARNFPIAK
ncbi:M3 family metallopeptidase [Flavobacterium macrobrachii]|uniref:M3 family metallopeptidase n=1 Tax=Flavobacterium macrobrachii TaxID=591204 RepID=A0ABS2CV02_9FLAO|nr:M3 family metallopeptidase [Flavobacterium macrobrachii]MBM6498800.1 M3 family metallopeptidase [Flavobacterium macrobrachii]PZO31222.1 MAG: peptidase M3 [Flavobacteriaceae bacterium]